MLEQGTALCCCHTEFPPQQGQINVSLHSWGAAWGSSACIHCTALASGCPFVQHQQLSSAKKGLGEFHLPPCFELSQQQDPAPDTCWITPCIVSAV